MEGKSQRTTLLIDLNEAGERLAISRRSVERLLENKELRAVRVGRRRLVSTAELERFVGQLRKRSH
jgi:excisionase family DNA binding protein